MTKTAFAQIGLRTTSGSEHSSAEVSPGDAVMSDVLESTDHHLLVAVQLELTATGYLSLRRLSIDIRRGVVVLRGEVPSFHQKQLAQVAVRKVNGIRRIANRLKVVCIDHRPTSESLLVT